VVISQYNIFKLWLKIQLLYKCYRIIFSIKLFIESFVMEDDLSLFEDIWLVFINNSVNKYLNLEKYISFNLTVSALDVYNV